MASLEEDRSELILEHLKRYRLTTTETLQRVFYPGAKNTEALKSQLRRLRERELVDSRPFIEKRAYYFLTSSGASHVHLAAKSGGPLDDQQVLRRRYASLLFSCHGDVPRPRFTVEEFDAAFPGAREGNRELMAAFHGLDLYLDSEGDTPRLGRMILVTSLSGDPAAHCRQAYRRACETFPDFVREDLFTLAVVTPTPGARDRLNMALATAPLREGNPVPLRIEAMTELLPLLEKRPEAATKTKRGRDNG